MYLRTVLLALLVAGAIVVAGCGSDESDSDSGATQPVATGAIVTITDPWAEVTSNGEDTGGVYMKLVSNKGDTLLKAEVDSATADRADLVLRAVPVSSIDLGANQLLDMKPRGSQIRLVGLKKPIGSGDMVDLKLTFEKAGALSVAAAGR